MVGGLTLRGGKSRKSDPRSFESASFPLSLVYPCGRVPRQSCVSVFSSHPSTAHLLAFATAQTQKKPPIGGFRCGGELIPPVFTPACTRLVYADSAQFRDQRLDLLPDPFGKHLAGWILQTRDVVQVVVVQLLIDGPEKRFDLREVPNPAGMGINVPFDIEGDSERMTMETAALVSCRYVGEAVGCLEDEFLEDFQLLRPG